MKASPKRPKGLPFSGFSFLEGRVKIFLVKYMKGWKNLSFRFVIKKGPKRSKRDNKFIFKAEKKSRNLLVLWLKWQDSVKRDAEFWTRYVKGVPFVNRGYIYIYIYERGNFSVQKDIWKSKGLDLGEEPSRIKLYWLPPREVRCNRAHYWWHHVYHCCLCFEPRVLSQGQSKSCRSRCSYSARGRLSVSIMYGLADFVS